MYVEVCIHLTHWRESRTGRNAGVIFTLKIFFNYIFYSIFFSIYILNVYKLYFYYAVYVICTVRKQTQRWIEKSLLH